MAGKSKNRRNNHGGNSSSNSSENDADPDYVARWSQRLSQRNNNFNPFDEYQVVNTVMGVAEIGSSSRKGGRPLKKKDNGQGELQKIQIPRKARAKRKPLSFNAESSTARGNKNSENEKMKATILSWLIGSETIRENTKVFCENKEGVIKRDGISCSCCNEVFTVSDFEVHAGHSFRQPYRNIFISDSRVSLFSCIIEAWNRPDEAQRRRFISIKPKQGATDSYDDACIICADGGNLLCCDNCTSTYHQVCMGMKVVPQDSWYCPYCICKFCKKPCSDEDYLLTCGQCEKRYHWECFKEREPLVLDLNMNPSQPFCEQSCEEVYEKLGNMVGATNDLDEGFTWTLLHRMDDEFGVCVKDLYQKTECQAKLAVGWRVMEECFETIKDRHTKINIIRSVVYNCGSNFNRINFRGFYTAVLEKDNEVISAASLRIHGNKLAEMPFIATREIYRGKGMCRRLMTAIESALCYMKVENLVIPSISERIGSWIQGYGFRIIEDYMSKEITCYNTLMFHDSLRLQKILLPSHSAEPNNAANEAMEVESKNDEHQEGEGLGNKSTMPALFDLNVEPPELSEAPFYTLND